MAAKPKELVLGLTVNLENYENLRFDYRADIETPEDAVEVAALAASSLLAIAAGAKDPHVQETIRKKVAGLFGISEGQLEKKFQPKDVTPEQIDTATANIPPKKKAVVKDGPIHGMETKMAAPAPKPDNGNGKKAPELGPAVAQCENCQAGVTAGQKTISQLFAGKTLCKECLNEVQGVKA
ncbi:MAG: hypothetical protein QMC96_12205 [Methanomicrobiales archaeon]|nr:hypothetical protein [Methanomicrobiales archaeon]